MKAELGEISEVWRNSPIAAVPPNDLMLVTDFDGTLAEIVPEPSQSVALEEALAALRRLAGVLRKVVVLSSRTSDELKGLVPVGGMTLIGDSGRPPLSHQERRALERFNAEAAEVLKAVPGAWLEIKPASTAVHVRRAALSGEEVLAQLRPLLKAAALHGALGRKVIEVHSPHSGKGNALMELLEQVQPAGLVAMGDDENDRPVFELVSTLPIPHLGMGVSSAEVPPDLFDRCDMVVSGPSEAAAFLGFVADWAEPF